jgi:hypothetical protein
MRAPFYPIMSLLFFTFAAGCSGSTETTDAGSDAATDAADGTGGADCSWFPSLADVDPPVTPVLNNCHPGYQLQHCDNCHSPLPRPNHTATDFADCAGCHGANGACDPDLSERTHSHTDDCIGCHQEKHEFNLNADCTACHFSYYGLAECP